MAPSYTQYLLRTISERLYTDTAFRAWCNSNLGTAANVFSGVPFEVSPNSAAYPLAAVHGVGRADRGGPNTDMYIVEIGVGVEQRSKTTTPGTPPSDGFGGALCIYDGFELAEAMRDQAEQAIFRAGIANGWKVDTSGQTANDIDGWFFLSYSSIMIEVKAGAQVPQGKK